MRIATAAWAPTAPLFDATGLQRALRAALRWALLAALLAAIAGCPGRTRRTLVPELPKSGDAQARARFQEARAKFLQDQRASSEFQRIVEEYPEDPIVPWAQLYAGMSALKARDWGEAATALRGVIEARRDPGLTTRAELFLGIAVSYQGDARAALEHLRRGEPGIEGDAERTEYLAALAYSSAAGPRPLAALPAFDQLWRRVTATERALIVERLEEVVASAEPGALRAAVDELEDRRGPATATGAARLAQLAADQGNAADAKRYRELAEPARAAVGLPRALGAVPGGPGAPGLLGAVLPYGGKANQIAEAAGAGLGLAAGAPTGKGAAAVEVRPADDPDAAALAVEDLARANVVAVVLGTPDGVAADAAIARAESLGVPLLSLHPQADKRATGRFAFHLVHSPVQRARILARRALAKGVKEIAVLAPDSAYGRGVSAAFAAELTAGGGAIVQAITYPTSTKSWKPFTDKLTAKAAGVFVPEAATALALITPALAASGYVPQPVGTKKVPGGRPVLLLSTAEGLDGRYVAEAGRLSVGALFAPGYFPEDHDPASKAFVDEFIAAYGRAPKQFEAYAYDAAQLAAGAVGGRAALAAALASGTLAGLTGRIQFDASHQRADDGVVYTVVEDAGAHVIRIAR